MRTRTQGSNNDQIRQAELILKLYELRRESQLPGRHLVRLDEHGRPFDLCLALQRQ